MKLREKIEHESFCMVQFSRCSCTPPKNLYGSNIKHSSLIRLQIKPSYKERDLNDTWYYTKGDTIIDIDFSEMQFAQLISSLNMGSGIPGTMVYLNGNQLQTPPIESTRDLFNTEFKTKCREILDNIRTTLDSASEFLTLKRPMKAKERDDLLALLYKIEQELLSNFPYVEKQFEESMEKTVAYAKSEIEAFLTKSINNMGIQKISEGLKVNQLESYEGEKQEQTNTITVDPISKEPEEIKIE